MNYSCTALVALVILLIINYDILLKKSKENRNIIPAQKSYRRFLLSVVIFYVCDTLWGLFYDLQLLTLTYIDTMVFFAVMAYSVFLWTRYVISYLKVKNIFTTVLNYCGWFFLLFEWIVVIVNLFFPVLFYFDENGTYVAGSQRYVNLGIQLIMFLMTSICMLYVSARNSGKVRFRHLTIGLFGIVMTVFVFLQMLFPFLALYSVGYMIGTCLLHTFIMEDIKADKLKELKELVDRERAQREQLGSAIQLAHTDSLTGVRNKLAYEEMARSYDEKIASGRLKELAVIVFDLNGLKIINDSKGHDEGDRYIKEGSRLICRWFKHSPVFRIGGDEFVALLVENDFAKRVTLLNGFNRLIENNISKENVVISTGMDDYIPKQDKNVEEVFVRADKKMYERKSYLKSIGSI